MHHVCYMHARIICNTAPAPAGFHLQASTYSASYNGLGGMLFHIYSYNGLGGMLFHVQTNALGGMLFHIQTIAL